MVALVEQIVHRQGFGDLLAEGCLRAAREIGGGTERYAMQVKGQEIPMHEPRVKVALGLAYAISPTGADHNHAIHDTKYAVEGRAIEDIRTLGVLDPMGPDCLGPQKVRLAKYQIDWAVFLNCVGLCAYPTFGRERIRDLVQAVSGWSTSLFELQKAGERALAMARAFNCREGFSAADDLAHWRLSTPLKSGAGRAVSPEEMAEALALYYEMCGWARETGAPTPAKLHELGVSWVADLLYGGEPPYRAGDSVDPVFKV
jgi:aldehyde:ferredoxin oxidoreductase